MSFFKPTKEEIDAATKKNPDFPHDTEVHFLVDGVKEKDGDDGGMIILDTKVLNTEFQGKPYAFFFRNSEASKGNWIRLLQAFFPNEKILAGLAPTELIGRQFKSLAKHTVKEGKTFINFNKFEEMSGANELVQDATGSDDIPF